MRENEGMDENTPRYFEHADPMWDEHKRTVDPACTCDYERLRNGLWQTLAIRRDVDRSCPIHGG